MSQRYRKWRKTLTLPSRVFLHSFFVRLPASLLHLVPIIWLHSIWRNIAKTSRTFNIDPIKKAPNIRCKAHQTVSCMFSAFLIGSILNVLEGFPSECECHRSETCVVKNQASPIDSTPYTFQNTQYSDNYIW